MKFFDQLGKTIQENSRPVKLSVFLVAAVATGMACVLFMWAFEFVLKHQLNEARIGLWCWITTPILFLLAVELIRRTAPFADGAGIPQTVFAASHLNETSIKQLHPLVSIRTMTIKIIALLLAVWAGASTGREGPTVHVAAALFLGIVLLARHITKIKFDLRSAVIAGGAAGLAAAFNTPLAGVTFAIEELSPSYFSTIKESVLLAIILAGISAKSLTGEYNYFGQLLSPAPIKIQTILVIGIIGGLAGALFSTALIKGRQAILSQKSLRERYTIPLLFGLGLLLLNKLSFFGVLGPGNKVAQIVMAGQFRIEMMKFPILKMAATLFTYWAGIAGGIFAPCLSIGASLGADVGYWMGEATAVCAILGMAAFLSGTIQAPITAFVIIFEMTDQHQVLLPVMLVSLIAVLTAKALGAKHLYQTLAHSYGQIIGYQPDSSAPRILHD